MTAQGVGNGDWGPHCLLGTLALPFIYKDVTPGLCSELSGHSSICYTAGWDVGTPVHARHLQEAWLLGQLASGLLGSICLHTQCCGCIGAGDSDSGPHAYRVKHSYPLSPFVSLSWDLRVDTTALLAPLVSPWSLLIQSIGQSCHGDLVSLNSRIAPGPDEL